MTNKRTFKVISEDLKAVLDQGAMTKERLNAALPLLVEAADKMASMRRVLFSVGKLFAELNSSASAYALEHQGIFIGGKLNKDGKGVLRGDLDAGDKVYHFAAGYEGLMREDGEALTQEFLAELPKNWTKGKHELDLTGITRLNVDGEELRKHGLVQKPKNVWTLDVKTIDVAE